MTPFETAFEKVAGLVREFAANEDHYLSSKYQEAEVREDFLNKFWVALGWDVRHKYQTNPREQEVKVERNPDSSATSRKADYAFYLLPDFKNPVFFCEAKKPSRKLGDPEFYFQLVRYGRGASTPVGVLTDFEEFHVIDCRYEPNIQKSYPSAQIRVFHFKDYLDSDKFGYIYWLFSREAIEAGKLKEFAKALPKQRGAGKAKLTVEESKPVDEAFLTKLEEYRLTLAKAFKKADESLNAEALTEATQKVIDRLVFIRFLEDKNIESDYIVDQIAAKKNGAWKSFISWSKELDVKYNGVVFKPHDIDKPSFVAPEDKIFAELCEDISHKYSKYLFSYIPIEILGSIYERFLGKVVTATAKRADIEYKPEVRKAGGVYYTPKYIVDYIVSNTVGKLIEGKTPKEISSMRFADIACGSGSFLIAVYDKVLHYIEKYYNENPSEATKAGCPEIDKGIFVLTLKQKQKILLDNIFGVDIDRQATEVAQLSLFLKLLESESDATAGQLSFEKTKILPDLSKNIQCGNSLVEYDIEQLFPLAMEELEKVKPFDFNTSFKGMKERGGFDAIVGNPPYVFTRNDGFTPLEKSYFYSRFKYQSAQLNSFGIFVEKAFQLLKKNGALGYITPNNWLTINTFELLRKFLIEETSDLYIINILDRVFQDADVDTAILFFQKNIPNVVVVGEMKNGEADLLTVDLTDIQPPRYTIQIGLLRNKEARSLLSKIENVSNPLSAYCTVSTGLKVYQIGKGKPLQGKTEKADRVFHSEIQQDKTFGKYLEGSDVSRYFLGWSGEYLSYGDWLAEPRKSVPYSGDRILIRQIPNKPPYLIHAIYTNESFFNDINSMVAFSPLNGISLKFLLGIINSRITSFWFSKSFDKLQRKIFPQFKVNELASFPIPMLDLTNSYDKKRHDSLINFVDQMLETKKRLNRATRDTEREQIEKKCEYLDSQIDKLVYELYGLTEEEIAIVEKG